MTHYIKPIKFLLISLISLSLYGCSDHSPEAMLDNYLYRLSNAIDVEQGEKIDIPVRPLFPHRRDRKIEIPDMREGLLDVLKLKECQLTSLIAERNSSLGKVYRPSLKMRYEIEFLKRLNHCIAKLEAMSNPDQELITLTSELYSIKTQHIFKEVWNGIYTSESIEKNFSRKFQPLPLQDDASTSASINALKQISDFLQQDFFNPQSDRAQLIQLEEAYKVLFVNNSGPKLFSSLELLTSKLSQATDMINLRLSGRPLCFNQRPGNQAKIMRNVFYKYYIGEVQPYIAQSHRYSDRWLKLQLKIYERLAGLNVPIHGSMEQYMTQVVSQSSQGSIWMDYINARDKHTQAWQNLLKQCGMMPTKTN